MHHFIRSRQGVYFTEEATAVMRDFADALQKENAYALSWSIAFDKNGQLTIGLGGDYAPQPKAISDSVAGIDFYWYAEPPGLEAIRQYCVDVGWERTSRLLPLPVSTSS
ncbi:MAG: hypothetical protein KF774_15635 [Planctomyces sp.]|nr:hypothetical protein [Planctomyces sp.]